MTAGNSADGLNQEVSAATTISSTGLTIPSGATFLGCVLASADGGSTIGPTAVSMTWNGTPMSPGPTNTVTGGGQNAFTQIFYLINPAAGTGPMVANWTTARDMYMSGTAFNGTDTVTGINAADNQTATNVTTITVTSAANDATLASFACNAAAPTVNFTKIYAEAPLSPGGGANYTLGGTSNAHTFTGAGGTLQALVGIHILAGTGGSQPPSSVRRIYINP